MKEKDGFEVVATAFSKTVLWSCSVILGLIATLFFIGNSHLSALLMSGAAIVINPIFVQHANEVAVEEGSRPPSAIIFLVVAFGLVVFSIHQLVS